jgi:hypothetical protein
MAGKRSSTYNQITSVGMFDSDIDFTGDSGAITSAVVSRRICSRSYCLIVRRGQQILLAGHECSRSDVLQSEPAMRLDV